MAAVFNDPIETKPKFTQVVIRPIKSAQSPADNSHFNIGKETTAFLYRPPIIYEFRKARHRKRRAETPPTRRGTCVTCSAAIIPYCFCVVVVVVVVVAVVVVPSNWWLMWCSRVGSRRTFCMAGGASRKWWIHYGPTRNTRQYLTGTHSKLCVYFTIKINTIFSRDATIYREYRSFFRHRNRRILSQFSILKRFFCIIGISFYSVYIDFTLEICTRAYF